MLEYSSITFRVASNAETVRRPYWNRYYVMKGASGSSTMSVKSLSETLGSTYVEYTIFFI